MGILPNTLNLSGYDCPMGEFVMSRNTVDIEFQKGAEDTCRHLLSVKPELVESQSRVAGIDRHLNVFPSPVASSLARHLNRHRWE